MDIFEIALFAVVLIVGCLGVVGIYFMFMEDEI